MSQEPVALTTDRLLLRPFRLSDVDAVFAYAADEEWSRYLLHPPFPYARGDAETFVARCVLTPWAHDAHFAIVVDDTVVGSINLNRDTDHERAELGYSLARWCWNRGITTEAAGAVLGYGFGDLQLARVSARADSRNVGSWRVMEKLGMRQEGVLRRHVVARDGRRSDEVLYGILSEEWRAD